MSDSTILVTVIYGGGLLLLLMIWDRLRFISNILNKMQNDVKNIQEDVDSSTP